MLIVTILLSLLIPSQNMWTDYVEKYNHLNSSGSHTAETVWAMSSLYHSSPDSVKPGIIEAIDSESIRNGLKDSEDFKSSILEINSTVRDESLLLLSLLLESRSQIRQNLFDNFYRDATNRDLYTVNLFARNGEEISPEFFEIRNFQFIHFLISFYISNNKVVSDAFFEKFNEYWINRTSVQQFDQFTEDFLYVTMAMSAHQLRSYGDLVKLYDKIKSNVYIPPSSLKRSIYWAIDFAFYRYGEIDKSLEVQRQFTIPISQYIGDQAGLNSIYASHGGYLYLLGLYTQARNIFQTALNQGQLSNESLSRLYNNLSLVYFKTGESSKYVDTQFLALDIAREENNYDYQIKIYRNLHIFYRKNRNWDLAGQYIDQAAELAIETENVSDLITIYISKAVFEDQYLNNREKAYQNLDLAEDYLRNVSDSRFNLRVLVERANILKKDQEWTLSKSILEKAQEISLEQSNRSIYLEILVKLSEVNYQLGQFNKAKDILREFRAHDITVVDFPTLVLSQTLQAQLDVKDGKYGEAKETFARVTDIVLERAQNMSELETGYWSVEPEYLNLFEAYTDFLISQNELSKAIVILDRVKTINDASLTENPLIKASVLSEEDLATERRISREMDQIRKELFVKTGRDRLELQSDLEQLSAQKRDLTTNLENNYVRSHPPVWNIRRGLNQGEVVLHITQIDSYYYLSVISRDELSVKKLPLSNDDKEMFGNAIESMVNGETNLDLLYRAGQYLDLPKIASQAKSIVIMADGYYHQIPMGVIPIRKPDSPFSYGSASYIIEHADIRTLNSLNDLIQKPQQNNYAYDYSGFGVSDFNNEQTSRNLISLPKAPEEIRDISDQLHRLDSRGVYIEDSATSETFKRVAGNSRILHLATHSEVSESDPLFSTLHFYSDSTISNGSTLNGQLFAYELFDLDLNNQLIMLNSCESGAGRVLQGSGIMGVSRALRYAGAQSLVLNAWSVNDHFAAEFAEIFYHYLNRGETKSRALQLTKIEFIKEKNANPHYWGPYLLNGDNQPILAKNGNQSGPIVLALLFAAGIFLIRREGSSPQIAALRNYIRN